MNSIPKQHRLAPFDAAGVALLAMMLIFLCQSTGCVEAESNAAGPAEPPTAAKTDFVEMEYWNDGLAEMCYYDATDEIYGKPRSYTRTMLMNREWMDPDTMVKFVGADISKAVPVFKITIAEEIPTENYNYRYLVSQYLRRSDLRFEKLAVSSQEWCGTTFKQLKRGKDRITLNGFSYFEGEGDQTFTLPADANVYPREALFALARQVAISSESRETTVMSRLRSTHLQKPQTRKLTLVPKAKTQRVTVPAGTYTARLVQLKKGEQVLAEYLVDASAPHLLLRYEDRESGHNFALRAFEKRAYWDRSSKSDFYRTNKAP